MIILHIDDTHLSNSTHDALMTDDVSIDFFSCDYRGGRFLTVPENFEDHNELPEDLMEVLSFASSKGFPFVFIDHHGAKIPELKTF